MIPFVTAVLLLAWPLNCPIAESAETFQDDYNVKIIYNSELEAHEVQGSDSAKAANADAPCGPTYKMCRDYNATTTSGIIQPLDPMVMGPSPKMCSFSIVAPPDYRIQMTCSIVQISRSCSFLKLRDGQMILADPPTADELYTSKGNVMVVDSQLLHYGNTFDCKWTMIAPITTTTTTTQRPLTTECGRSKFTSTASSRILGGTEANPNEFPWMVHLVVNKDGGPYTCAGTLISNQHFVTGMDCFLDRTGNVSFSGFKSITLGAHDFSANSNDRNRQVVQWLNGGFPSSPQLVENDIAIFKLNKPAILNDYVQPACLPFANEPDHLNDPVVLTGWGDYIPGVPSPVLRKVTTTVISSAGTNGQCQQTAGIGPFSGDKVICSDGSKGRRLCNGEKGGPMNYYSKELGRWFFIGIGMRRDEGNCLTNCKPNVFTRVKALLYWICRFTGDEVTPPDGKCY